MNNETNPTYFLKGFILPVHLERVRTANTERNTEHLLNRAAR